MFQALQQGVIGHRHNVFPRCPQSEIVVEASGVLQQYSRRKGNTKVQEQVSSVARPRFQVYLRPIFVWQASEYRP